MMLTKDELLIERDALEHSMYLAAYRNRIRNLFDTIAALQLERDALRKALELSAVRLDICVGRMRGCNDEPQKHELLDEVRSWAIEAREALSTPGQQGACEETMSHPPETSKELAEAIVEAYKLDNWPNRGIALIDAWVREREAWILEEVALSFERLYWKLDGAVDAAKCVRAFATARKQQETL